MARKIKFYHSLVSKFGLFMILVIIIAILTTGLLIYREAINTAKRNAFNNLNYTSALTKQSFYSLLNQVANDINLIARYPLVNDEGELNNIINNKNLEYYIRSILESKPDYLELGIYQIRMDKNLKAQNINGNIHIKRNETLSSRKKTLINNASIIRDQSYYYSEIYLKENGNEIAIPRKPVFNASTAIYNNSGETLYIIDLEVDLSPFYNQLIGYSNSGVKVSIIDQYNQYIFTPSQEKCFGQQTGMDYSFKEDFGLDITDIPIIGTKEQLIQDKNKENIYYQYETLSYPNKELRLHMMTYISEAYLFSDIGQIRLKILRIVLLIVFIALLGSLLFTYIFSRRLVKFAKIISSEKDSKREELQKLVRQGHDEIGLAVEEFLDMDLKMEQQMQAVKHALEKEKIAKRDKNEFIQNMSHDLRSPLNAITGITQLLLKNNPSQHQLPMLESLSKSADNLSDLISDVLDKEKLDSGVVQLSNEQVIFSELLKDIVKIQQYEALKKGLKLELEISSSLENKTLLTDSKRISQILTNLLTNAIKFTASGFVKVSAKLVDNSTELNPTLHLKIEDSGIGISSENLELINTRFYRENHVQKETEGHGIGLSIVKGLVDLFRGKLSVDSSLGNGSSFILELPVTLLENPIIHPKKEETDHLPKLDEQKKILILEDDPIYLDYLKYIFEDLPLLISEYNDFQTGIAMLEKDSPDLIISDLHFKNTTSETVLSQLVKLQNPFIIISGIDIHSDLLKDICFLQKPVKNELILATTYMVLLNKKYKAPDWELIIELYDGQKEKLLSYFNILENEFKKYYYEINQLKSSTTIEKDYSAIRHKLKSHIKSLQLEDLDLVFPEKYDDLFGAHIEEISNILNFYLCCVKYESYRISLTY